MLIICIKRHVPTASDQLWSVKRGGDGTLPGGYCSRGCDGRGERFITLVLSGQLVRENRFLRRRESRSKIFIEGGKNSCVRHFFSRYADCQLGGGPKKMSA